MTRERFKNLQEALDHIVERCELGHSVDMTRLKGDLLSDGARCVTLMNSAERPQFQAIVTLRNGKMFKVDYQATIVDMNGLARQLLPEPVAMKLRPHPVFRPPNEKELIVLKNLQCDRLASEGVVWVGKERRVFRVRGYVAMEKWRAGRCYRYFHNVDTAARAANLMTDETQTYEDLRDLLQMHGQESRGVIGLEPREEPS